jgi:uncharacterized protein (UPF0335 family)
MADTTEDKPTDSPKGDSDVGGIAAERLRSIIERIERLEEERKALGDDIKDIFSEAKSAGFDVKVIRQVIRLRKQEPADVEEQETLLDLYGARSACSCVVGVRVSEIISLTPFSPTVSLQDINQSRRMAKQVIRNL